VLREPQQQRHGASEEQHTKRRVEERHGRPRHEAVVDARHHVPYHASVGAGPSHVPGVLQRRYQHLVVPHYIDQERVGGGVPEAAAVVAVQRYKGDGHREAFPRL